MCKFFSLVSKGDGKPIYFDWDLRQKCLSGELGYSPDSHTSIADYDGFKGAAEDRLNKYEFNPLTKKFVVDQINTIDDRDAIERFCMTLDFRTIVPALVIKPIIHPLKDFYVKKPSSKDLILLKKWASVWDSMRDSVWASVWNSVRNSVGDSVWDSMRDSVENSVWASMRDSVWVNMWDSMRANMWDSVGANVLDSVWDSVWAYFSSFFKLDQWEYFKSTSGEDPFQPTIDLWEKGIVPSFDGKKWYLYGHTGKIIWAGTIEEADDFITAKSNNDRI